MEVCKIAAMAEAYHVPVAPHNMYGPVATMTSVQLCACIPDFTILEYQWGDVCWRDELTGGAIPVKGGYIEVTDEPGIGLQLNHEALEQRAV